MIFPHGQTVTVIRPAAKTSTGDPSGPPSAPHTIAGCAIGRGSRLSAGSGTDSETDHRDATVTDVDLFCPPGADIRAGDRVLLPGDDTVYLVVGQPGRWHSPYTGWEPGVDVKLTGVR
ncbi:hypothetical protein [Nocardia sp. NPDC057030]|uniref:hypothetical protein n=1 Tax=unclassified Nocardia TaxID=2637762 RepID=UPI00362F7E0E